MRIFENMNKLIFTEHNKNINIKPFDCVFHVAATVSMLYLIQLKDLILVFF